MNTNNIKKKYILLQLKLFDYVDLLDGLLTKYLENPNSISYKKISNIYRYINTLLLQNYTLQNMIICY